MSRRRATIVTTINSIAALPKVSSSTLALIKHITTSTQTTDFQFNDSLIDNHPSSNHHTLQPQNPNQNQSLQGSNGYYRGNHGAFGNNQNGVFGDNLREVERNRNGVCGESSNAFQYNQNGVFGDNLKDVERSRNGVYGESYNAFQYNQNVGFGGNPNSFRQNQNRNFEDNLREIQQQPNPNSSQQSRNGFYGGNPIENQQRSGGFYNQNRTSFQDSTYTSSHGVQPRAFEFNQASQNQNFNVRYEEDPMRLTTSTNGFYGANSKEYEQRPIGYNRESINHQVPNASNRITQDAQNGFYQESPSPLQGSANGYNGRNFGEVQQSLNGYDNQYSSNGNVGDSVKNEDICKYKGTLDELDLFCKEGKMKEAFEVMDLLDKQGIQIDEPRYLQLMHACGEAAILNDAKDIHQHFMKSMIHVKVSIHNKIMDMYSKCGSMPDAYGVFERMPERNLTSWDTMIVGLAKNGLGEDAIDMFSRFKEAGMKPDAQMFVGVFSACSVLGDIDEGMLHFESMNKVYGIIPSMGHYLSVVDMLGSTGYFDEAMEFIEKMPFEPSVDIWVTLMNLSRIHGNMELGDRCAELVEKLDSSRLTDQSKVGLLTLKASDLAKEKLKKKMLGQNPLEAKSRVHEYRAGDTSHPEKDIHYALLKGMQAQMREAGYVPLTRFCLHDVDEEIKEEMLLGHSERLAVAQGLISSSARSDIRIIKNLRVCGDCHNAMKLMAKLTGRTIIARDAKRFHHFKDGVCSCKDYW
ncbi:hypothetical protein GIB67_005408 [Kingdonia uniflora]|uniref:DYW domain-containing protein n=1 Tax=Kingdonia uniflora TaxID=39325 RepID=A0A7J7NH82_9MAGN|nr:hypothetical protein GIB67_005408 [Kingdonia uniflora]